MNKEEKVVLVENFEDLKENGAQPFAIAAMKALLEFARRDDSTTTMQEFIVKMGEARKVLQSSSSHASVRSGCELFVRFITFSQLELEQASDFRSCREILLKRGQNFVDKMQLSSSKIIETCDDLIVNDMRILTHARSRNVLNIMEKAVNNGIRFKVFVTEAQPSCDGKKMAAQLKRLGIPAIVILDSSVAFFIEKIDLVIIGAEGICKDGGIINTIGTCNIAMLAHFKNKPVHVLAESFKFIRLLPLNNRRLPEEFAYSVEAVKSGRDLDDEQPLVDYTDPKFLSYIYTDLGMMHTTAVIEHLINIYT